MNAVWLSHREIELQPSRGALSPVGTTEIGSALMSEPG